MSEQGMRLLYVAVLPVLAACTAATEPTIVQTPQRMCCGYTDDDWQEQGVAWAAGHALEAACACAGAHGSYGARVTISPSGELVSAEPTFVMGADPSDRCVFDAITNAVRDYLASRPGEYPFEVPTRLVDARAARAFWVPAPACADARRYVSLPESQQWWRFAGRRLARHECRRPVQAVIADVTVVVGEP